MSQTPKPLYTTKYIWRRVFAGLIDYIISILVPIGTSVLAANAAQGKGDKTAVLVAMLWLIGTLLLDLILFVLYPLKFDGRTLGKHILGIKIVDREGNSPDLMALISRRYLQYVILIFFPFLAVIFLFRRDKQNLWDLISSTYVVNKEVEALPNEMLPKARTLNAPSELAYRYGGFFFDNALIIDLLMVFVAVILMLPQSTREKFMDVLAVIILLIVLGFGYILRPIYEVISYKTKGQTLGKRIFGTQIVNFKTKEKLSTLKITLREFFKFVLYSLIGGIFPIIFLVELVKTKNDPNRRSIIDGIGGSQVVNVKGGKKYPGRYLVVLLFSSLILAILLGMLFFFRYAGELDKEDTAITPETTVSITPSPTPTRAVITPTTAPTLIPTPTAAPTQNPNTVNSSGVSNTYNPQERNGKILDIKDRGARGRNYITVNDAEIGIENAYTAEWCKDTDMIIYQTGRGSDITNMYFANSDIWITDLSGNTSQILDFGEFPNKAALFCDKGMVVYGTKNKVGKVNTDGTGNQILMEFTMVNTRSEFFMIPEILTIDGTHIYVNVPDENGDYFEWKIARDGGKVEKVE